MGVHTQAAVQATTRTWASLTYSEAHGMRDFLKHHPLGREARQIAGDDHDFALWLVDAATAYAKQAQKYPNDLSDCRWRKWHDNRLGPRTAARVALHLEPVARIVDNELICPICSGQDTIVERDVSVRHNSLGVSDGRIYAGLGDGTYDNDGFVCQRCGVDVDLARCIEDWM